MDPLHPTGSGLMLERFSPANADLVLSWRNASHVRANSLEDAEIQKDDHLRFVQALATSPNRHFFVLRIDDTPEAVLNVNLDGQDGVWGCYIGDNETPRPGLFPVLIATAGILAFELFGCKALNSEVVSANAAPQKINTFLQIPVLGHRTDTRRSGEEIDVVLYRVAQTDWPALRQRIDRILPKRQRSLLTDFSANPEDHIV